MFKRILVHLDALPEEAWLIARLVPLAKRLDAKIELFCCGYNRSLKHSHIFDAEAGEHAEHGFVRQREAVLEQLAKPLLEAGIDTGIDACWEPETVEGILQKAERFDADLILCELKERTLLERVLGEMEAELARETKVPLLLVKPRNWHARPLIAAGVNPFHDEDGPHPLDNHVLDFLGRVTESLDGVPSVLHAIHTIPHSAIFDEHVVMDYDALRESVSEEHHKVVEALVASSVLPDNTTIHYLAGEAHQKLPQYASETQLDLLILGHSEHSLLDRMLTNDMVTRVLSELSCDLLVVK